MIGDQQEQQRPPHPPRYIGDCAMAKKAGIYEFLLHMTQGFERFEDRWCQECLLEAGIWWEFKELVANLAPEEHEQLKAKASAELDRRRERSQKSREERQAWREFREQTPLPKDRPRRPSSQTQNVNPVNAVINAGSGNASGAANSTGVPPIDQKTPRKEEANKKETKQPPQDEPSFLQTTGKLFGAFGRWIATGKTK